MYNYLNIYKLISNNEPIKKYGKIKHPIDYITYVSMMIFYFSLHLAFQVNNF